MLFEVEDDVLDKLIHLDLLVPPSDADGFLKRQLVVPLQIDSLSFEFGFEMGALYLLIVVRDDPFDVLNCVLSVGCGPVGEFFVACQLPEIVLQE